ncbi:MAG: FAD-dependent oxidoreductase [Myxococcaceae bacterium]
MNKKTVRKKVIIVGAGISGLAACRQLIEYGFEAIILEARDRIGGRIVADDRLGITFGSGASWIHGNQDNPMTLLAEQFGAQMLPFDYGKFQTFDRNGQSVSHQDIQKFETKFEAYLEKAKQFAYQCSADISLSAALSTVIKFETFTPIEEDLFNKKLSFFEGYIGDDSEYLSARYWDLEESWPGQNCFLTSGYGPILEGLQKDCPVQLNSAVMEINTRVNDIEIITKNSIFYADAVLVTVPLGVLKQGDLKFNPPLPDSKQTAIQNLEMGLFNITAMKFKSAFWPKEPHALFFTQFDKQSIQSFFNLYHFVNQPVLVGYTGGDRARRLEHFSDAEIIERTLSNLESVFGVRPAKPEIYFNTRWSQDSFSRGSFSYLKTGASGADYESMAEPVSGRLFFAGEATSLKYPATTHGAYLSGIREAKRIEKCIKYY